MTNMYKIPKERQSQDLRDLLLGVSDGSSKPYNLRERTFIFARRILDITAQLPRLTECDVIRTQLVKSGTSIGANVEEADGASTKRDFRNKISIARKEAKETYYWLRLISGKFLPADTISGDIQEVHELTRIMSTILDRTKR